MSQFIFNDMQQVTSLNNVNRIKSWINLAEAVNSSFFGLDFFNLLQQKYPVFAIDKNFINWNLPFWERGVAVIREIETGQFAVYDRFDGLARFPGGHLDEGENYLQAAVRETEEEIGLTGLEFQKYLGSCHLFAPYQGKVNHLIEHYALFQIDLGNWQNKKPDEKGMRAFLASSNEILKNGWPQVEWVLETVKKGK